MKNQLISYAIGSLPVATKLAVGLLAAISLLVSAPTQAEVARARVISVANPLLSNGIQIGDVMDRKIVIETDKTYQVSATALPMKGLNRNGIELVNIQTKTTHLGMKSHHEIALRYQVFASAPAPAIMQLPTENFVLSGGPQALSVKLPAWRFWFSPLVVADLKTAKNNMQPQYRPSLIDSSKHQSWLTIFVGMFVAGLIGMIYINADRSWLPFMGGAFAKAHRRLKRLSGVEGEEKAALKYLHEAFNQIHGRNLFASDIDVFIIENPTFSSLKKEIADFFQRSGKALFSTPPNDRVAFIRELVILSKRLRNCERGVA